jgi:desampylase
MLILSEPLRARLFAEAAAAHPREICGLLEGIRDGADITVTALHPAANLSQSPEDSFAIDPAVQFALQRALRGTGRTVVGCYHSHPGGRAEPSPRDRATGCPDGFVWVIIATGVNDAIAAFEGPALQPLTIRN